MRKALYQYGLVLIELNEFSEAVIAFDKALNTQGKDDGMDEAEILTLRGIAKQKACLLYTSLHFVRIKLLDIA